MIAATDKRDWRVMFGRIKRRVMLTEWLTIRDLTDIFMRTVFQGIVAVEQRASDR